MVRACTRYARLGSDTEHDEPAGYGFVRRGPVELQLVPDDPDEHGGTGGMVHLYVSDAEALHREWTSAGIEGRYLGPHNTPYGLREFVLVRRSPWCVTAGSASNARDTWYGDLRRCDSMTARDVARPQSD